MNSKLVLALYKILAAKKVYYHGTSSKFLRNILKNGILPDTKEGVWKKESEDTDRISPSKKSFGGSYWANDASTAIRYAYDASKKLGGNQLIIAANLETKTATPDEDDFLGIINRGIDKLWGDQWVTSGDNALMFSYLAIRLGNKTGRDIIINWRKKVTQWLDPIMGTDKYKTKEFYKNADRLLVAELERRLSHIEKEGYYTYRYYMRDAVDRLRHHKKLDLDECLKRFPQKTKAEGENGRRHYLDFITRKTRKVLEQERTLGGTLRILTPVAFSGANKIVMILEAIENKGKDNTLTYTFKLHYGKILPEFLETWKSRQGYKYTIEE